MRLPDNTGQRLTFDQAGRVTAVADMKDDTVLRSTTHTYDAVGNVLTTTDPVGATMKFTCDALDQLRMVSQPVTAATSIDTSFGYDVRGNRTRFIDGRGNDLLTRTARAAGTCRGPGRPGGCPPSASGSSSPGEPYWRCYAPVDGAAPIRLDLPSALYGAHSRRKILSGFAGNNLFNPRKSIHCGSVLEVGLGVNPGVRRLFRWVDWLDEDLLVMWHGIDTSRYSG